MISVLVLTKNEEQDLPGCLASVSWSDDVQVLDSMSADRTVEVAREYGAQVTQRAFKAKEIHEEAEAVQSYRSDSGSSSGGTSLGDLLKEHIGSGDRG